MCGKEVTAMAKKTVSESQTTLDWLLNTGSDDQDNLTLLAREIAKGPPDVDSFRKDLEAKLARLRYMRGDTGYGKTFHDILTDAKVLNVLLHDEVLQELSRWCLLGEIARRGRELEREKKAVDGESLHELNKRANQMLRDLISMEAISDRYDLPDEMEKPSKKLGRRYTDLVKLILAFSKDRMPRYVLFSGETAGTQDKKPKNEDVATKVRIYRTLQQKLQTPETKKNGVTDRVLLQLAELVFAPPNVQSLPVGKALYEAARRAA
jgi:hypothetical protein